MNPLPSPLISYNAISTIEKIGSFPIHLWALRDIDLALNEICEKYDPKNPAEEELLLNLCPYFGIVWPSARALGQFMSERKSLFTKRLGIEVGCGLGLPSILAARMGSTMHASDFHPDVKDWILKNAALNEVRLSYAHWDWTDQNPPAPLQYGTYDFVLASDVLYEHRHPEELARALARLIHPKGSIYLSDPGRSYLNRALLELEKLNFRRAEFTYDVEESSPRPEVRLEKTCKIHVYEFVAH